MQNDVSLYENIFKHYNEDTYMQYKKIILDKINEYNDINNMTLIKKEFCNDVYLRVIFTIGVCIFYGDSMKEIKKFLNLNGYAELFTEEYIIDILDKHHEAIIVVQQLLNNIIKSK